MEYQELILKIIETALLVNEKTKHTVFIHYSGHVNEFSIDIHLNGWEENKGIDIKFRTYLDNEMEQDIEKKLEDILKQLEELCTKCQKNRSCNMSDKVEIGDYVRTKNGLIAKFIGWGDKDEDVDDCMLFDNCIYEKWHYGRWAFLKSQITKHSIQTKHWYGFSEPVLAKRKSRLNINKTIMIKLLEKFRQEAQNDLDKFLKQIGRDEDVEN